MNSFLSKLGIGQAKTDSRKQAIIQPREKHQWQLSYRSYAAPAADLSAIDLTQLPVETVLKLSLGVTTYIWECSLTGDIRKEEILGSDSDVLQDILVKAKLYGKQYISDSSGQKYVIDVFIPPQDLTALPVRK